MTTSTIRKTAAVAILSGALTLVPASAVRAQATDTAMRSTTTQTTTTPRTDDDNDDHGKWGLAGLLGLLGLLGMRRREPDRVVETRTTTDPNIRR
jgi:MYXO-CTERM domain-containing protein